MRDRRATGGLGAGWWPAGCLCAGTRTGLDGRATSDGERGVAVKVAGGWGERQMGTRGGGRGRTGRGPVSGARGAEGAVGGSA